MNYIIITTKRGLDLSISYLFFNMVIGNQSTIKGMQKVLDQKNIDISGYVYILSFLITLFYPLSSTSACWFYFPNDYFLFFYFVLL